MPPGTESVIVQRVSMLTAKESIFRDEYNRHSHDRRVSNIWALVHDAVDHNKLVVSALGGSDFEAPPTSGMTGNFNARTIYVVEQPLDVLRRQLETGQHVYALDDCFEFDGVDVFEGTIGRAGPTHNSTGESRFVAIPHSHTVVLSETREDIEYMLTSLRAKKIEIPHQWRAVAKGHDLESAIVILREYLPEPEQREPGTLPCLLPGAARPTHLALTLIDVKRPTLKIALTAQDPQGAIRWYHDALLLAKEGFAWDVTPTATGVTGTIGPEWEGAKPSYTTLTLILLFGPCVIV